MCIYIFIYLYSFSMEFIPNPITKPNPVLISQIVEKTYILSSP